MKQHKWSAFCALLRHLRDNRPAGPGLQLGWHCRHARQQRAQSVIGEDVSEDAGKGEGVSRDSAIHYRQSALEDVDFTSDLCDRFHQLRIFHHRAPGA